LKVYISADMEGITGLVDSEDVQPPGRDYERGRVMMTEDVNAAIRGGLTFTLGSVQFAISYSANTAGGFIDAGNDVAIEVVSVPEPTGVTVLVFGVIATLDVRWRRNRIAD